MSESAEEPGGPEVPSPAGIYDFLLGGDVGTAADREAALRIIAALPVIPQIAWANRGFLMRAVTWMAQEHGIRQFIDIGAGFPAQKPTHEVARVVAPECRVLYTDNDPAAVARGARILDGVPGTAVIEVDIRQPRTLFGHPEARRLIDPGLPTGLLVVAVTQFVPDEDDPWSLVAQHMAPLAPGSCLALSAPTADRKVDSQVNQVVGEYARTSVGVNRTRTKAEIERFFSGLDFAVPYEGAAPGVTFVGLWGCDDPEAADDDSSRWFYAGVAAKPGMYGSGMPGKPTVRELGIDPADVEWKGSGEGPGTVQVAFVSARGADWVLLRIQGSASGLVSLFTRFEWECFLDGAKRGEFDGATQ